jgi:hypothetical protein
MVAMKELKGVAHNLADHSQSSLSWLHPHLAQACRKAGKEGVSFDLLSDNPYPDGLEKSEPLVLALASLREWFFAQLDHLGHDRANITRAVLTFKFRGEDGYNSAVAVTIGTNTGKEYFGRIDFI